MVNRFVNILENIENYLLDGRFPPEKVLDGFHGDFSGLLVRKVKFSGRDTTECYAFQAMSRRQFQAGAVAGRQALPSLAGNMTLDDGADGVQDIPGRKNIKNGKEMLQFFQK